MEWPDDVDPAALRQPDARSCGATVAVAARVLLEPSYRPDDMGAAILATHRRLTSPRSTSGGLQLPWPPALGTPPWALAAELSALTGVTVRTDPCRWRLAAGWEALAAGDRRPVAAYVGNAWLPRHVVLVLGTDTDAARLLDPASGTLVSVAREAWVGQRLAVAGWSTPWAVL